MEDRPVPGKRRAITVAAGQEDPQAQAHQHRVSGPSWGPGGHPYAQFRPLSPQWGPDGSRTPPLALHSVAGLVGCAPPALWDAGYSPPTLVPIGCR